MQLDCRLVDTTQAVELLNERLAELSQLAPDFNGPELKEWRHKTDATLRRILGEDDRRIGEFQYVRFLNHFDGPPEVFVSDFESGRASAMALLRGVIYDLEVLSEPATFASAASIDPELWEHVRRLVEQEQWAQVASQTAIFVEDMIRQWAGLSESSYGKELMVAVLKPGAGAFPLGQTSGEQEGWLAFGLGLAQGVGNATRHRIQRRDDDKRYAMGVLGTGSLLPTQLRYEHGNRFRS